MKYLSVLSICLLALNLTPAFAADTQAEAVADKQAEVLTAERQAQLTHLLKHDCGSCHGMTLKGGLGPALTPDVLMTKPEAYLFHVISFGRKDTPMPPWQGILSKEDIQWLVSTLKEGVD